MLNRMKPNEIKELLQLKGWSKKTLAERLGMSPNAIYRWFIDREPGGPASVLMRQWLAEARKSQSMPAT